MVDIPEPRSNADRGFVFTRVVRTLSCIAGVAVTTLLVLTGAPINCLSLTGTTPKTLPALSGVLTKRLVRVTVSGNREQPEGNTSGYVGGGFKDSQDQLLLLKAVD